MQARSILINLSPIPARPEKPAPPYKYIFEIKSKCTTVNWQKSIKFHENNVQLN